MITVPLRTEREIQDAIRANDDLISRFRAVLDHSPVSEMTPDEAGARSDTTEPRPL